MLRGGLSARMGEVSQSLRFWPDFSTERAPRVDFRAPSRFFCTATGSCATASEKWGGPTLCASRPDSKSVCSLNPTTNWPISHFIKQPDALLSHPALHLFCAAVRLIFCVGHPKNMRVPAHRGSQMPHPDSGLTSLSSGSLGSLPQDACPPRYKASLAPRRA